MLKKRRALLVCLTGAGLAHAGAAAAASTVGLAAASAAGAARAGTVTGTIEVGDRRLKLTHVLVVALGNEEGLEDAPFLRIVVADAEVPMRHAVAATNAGLRAWARRADITAAMITADATGKEQGGVYVLLSARGFADVAIGSASGNRALAPFKVAGGRASGKAAFEASTSLIDASFDAPVVVVPAQQLSGTSAADSAQASALAAFHEAMRKGDLEEAAKVATAQRMGALAALRAASPPTYQAVVQAMPTGAATRRAVARVVVRGDTASVVRGKTVNEMVSEGGVWKVD